MNKWTSITTLLIAAVSVVLSACTTIIITPGGTIFLYAPAPRPTQPVQDLTPTPPIEWIDPTPDATPTQEVNDLPLPDDPPEVPRPIWYVVSASVLLNVRSGPGVKHGVEMRLAPGTLVQVRFDTDSYQSGANFIWAYVHDEQGKTLGWVALDYLELYRA